MEEGAEDFIVKPVKLADVKRLKDYMFGDDGIVRENIVLVGGGGGINKRKLQQMSHPYSSSSPSPPSIPSSFSSPSSSELPNSSTPSSSPPHSPSSLDSPTRQLYSD